MEARKSLPSGSSPLGGWWEVGGVGEEADRPMAASDLQPAEESQSQLVSRALTGFLEEVGQPGQ